MAKSFLKWTGGLVIAGGVYAKIKYKSAYEAVHLDEAATVRAFSTFSIDNRREFYDVAVVGGGIVGVATAREIKQRFPSKRVIMLEKEADVALHQSSHNSGVVHAGMYYKQNSLMARLCPRGHDLIMEYCRKNKLPLDRVGKLIVAVKETEIPAVENLYKQGVENGVRDLKMLRGEEEIKRVEPNVRGLCALYSPDTAITDFSAVARHMLKELLADRQRGFVAQFCYEALDFVGVSIQSSEGSKVTTPQEMVLIRGREGGQLGPEKTVMAKNVVMCCGLSNDLLAQRSGTPLSHIGRKVKQTFSFRGRYYQLRPEARKLVSMNVYPAPEEWKGISVGVHFTPTVDERRGRQVIIGPGSSVATHRYGYSPYCFDADYCFKSFFSKGGWVSLVSNIGTVFRMFVLDTNRQAFLREAQKLIPSLQDSDMEESFCGVMGVAVTPDGKMENDLAMEFSRPRVVVPAVLKPGKVVELVPKSDVASDGSAVNDRPLMLNVRNAPSPAATASMAIAEAIVDASAEQFRW
ncbi:hypothetical protein, conserved [Trypanosoma brucei brucei TREU927]|uniref:L-2-hydroxyglutarate dehydrogenase, mitochondrial n=1 Tax=Trypanosoma brucei brucei (strain 927/4 GUTat10.1) TaxID=185431 RepID=Q38A39_TRYB2|nr:hypothetical protein, conserved [Trypanosoma brucei brucei TREU927]EAN78331.1 hypothetical protein, conserved [Trypanosoma brucei brucei TREU927]